MHVYGIQQHHWHETKEAHQVDICHPTIPCTNFRITSPPCAAPLPAQDTSSRDSAPCPAHSLRLPPVRGPMESWLWRLSGTDTANGTVNHTQCTRTLEPSSPKTGTAPKSAITKASATPVRFIHVPTSQRLNKSATVCTHTVTRSNKSRRYGAERSRGRGAQSHPTQCVGTVLPPQPQQTPASGDTGA